MSPDLIYSLNSGFCLGQPHDKLAGVFAFIETLQRTRSMLQPFVDLFAVVDASFLPRQDLSCGDELSGRARTMV